jgi:hypothetical protein
MILLEDESGVFILHINNYLQFMSRYLHCEYM